MKKILTLIVLAGAMRAPALIIEADAPMKFVNGTDIPSELSAALRGTLYMKSFTSSKWTKIGTTVNSTFRWTVADPVPGVWQFCVTAQFLDLANTASALSETRNFEVSGAPNASGTDPATDTDADGMTDLCELIAGTSPTDKTSVLSVTCTVLPGGRRQLSWFGVKGRSYTCQYRDSFADDNWQSHPSEFTGSDTVISFTDQELAMNRFYRVRVRIGK
jgi:hypothetical protein